MKNFDIIGTGPIGEKASELLAKTPTLIELGFKVPRRTVLAQGFFDGYFQRNGFGQSLDMVNPSDDLESRVRNGSFTLGEFESLKKLSLSFGATPLAVRSSAMGDARGTGTYKTVFTDNKLGPLSKGVKEVLASYFSPSAIAFRKDANLESGFGVLLEPIVGHRLPYNQFAPFLSGFGYTSSAKGEGYISIIPLLGGGVDSKLGEILTEKGIKGFDGNFEEYLHETYMAMSHGDLPRRRSLLLRNERDGFRSFMGSYFHGSGFSQGRGRAHGGLIYTSFGEGSDFERALSDFNALPLFQTMKEMEVRFGVPHYFEFAVTLRKNKPVYWITQIAGLNPSMLDFQEFGGLENAIFMGNTVTGTGTKECRQIVDCFNPSDVDSLHEYNKTHSGYLLVFSSRLTTLLARRYFRMNPEYGRTLEYQDFSNASVLVEIQDADHVGNPIAHLGGQVSMTDKFFAVLDYDAEVKPQFDRLENHKKMIGRIGVYDLPLRVVANERKDKLVVYEQK